MSTEVVKTEKARAPVRVGERGVQIGDMDQLWRFSQYVAASGLAPTGIKTCEAIFVAVQMGLEIGLTPMAALQNIAVINGRPSVWGDAQLAVVRGSDLMVNYLEEETNDELHPLFVDFCTEPDVDKARQLRREFVRKQAKLKKGTDDYGYSVCTQRVGEAMVFGRFTVLDARTAGLWDKAGPWKQYPQRMLKFRARSFLLRDTYGDALKGTLSTEEARDLNHEDARFAAAKPAVATAAMLPEPPAPEPIPAPQPEPEAVQAAPEPAKEEPKTRSNPHNDLRAFLSDNEITPDAFLTWADNGGHIQPGTTKIADISAARVKLLLSDAIKAEMVKALGAKGEQ